MSDDCYVVGGVRLARPFKIRRLGHFGFNADDVPGCLAFYRDVLGFRVSDMIDYRDIADPAAINGLGDPLGYFMRYGTDHHAFVLFNRRVREALDTEGRFRRGVTANQITWQVGSLKEVVEAIDFLASGGTRISRSGRDTPGSNWHTYVFDPDGHTVELYYGIEQIGWNGRSKPKSMYNRGFKAAPALPQISEEMEVSEAGAAGGNLETGFASAPQLAEYDVEGIRLPRPFAIAGIGPVGIFVEELEPALAFYRDRLGLAVTEMRSTVFGKVAFLRANTEHHAIALYENRIRERLPVRQDTTSLHFGVRLATYAQLRAAVRFFEAMGIVRVELPPELFAGVRHAAFFADPDGHLIQLYFEMEQIGSGGVSNAGYQLDQHVEHWPESIAATADTYAGEPFLGPWL